MARAEEQIDDCAAALDAYIANRLAEAERERVERHLSQCPQCQERLCDFVRMIAPESHTDMAVIDAIYQQTESHAIALRQPLITSIDSVVSRPRASFSNRHLTVAAALVMFIVGALVGLFMLFEQWRDDRSIAESVATLEQIDHGTRPGELRISGFAYAAYDSTRGQSQDNRLIALRDRLASVVVKNPTPAARHALARALIITTEYSRAISELEYLKGSSNDDAALLSDLAVARAASGDLSGALAELNLALAADPASREALFNRALVFEKLKQDDRARADWQSYLQLDSRSAWAEEARRNLQRSS